MTHSHKTYETQPRTQYTIRQVCDCDGKKHKHHTIPQETNASSHEEMANFTVYEDIECIYPISGQYGNAPRALYYFLLLFVVLFRRKDWLTAGAAGFCLTSGGSAAIHAILLSFSKPGHAQGVDGVIRVPTPRTSI